MRRKAAYAVQRGLSPLNSVALKLARPSRKLKSPVIFIIGAPRSGTTLLYQVMAESLDVAYFTNFTGVFSYSPTLGFWLAKFLPRWRQEPYRSAYGKTDGLWGPHEAGRFWYRWFPSGANVYVAEDGLPASAEREMSEEIRAIVAVSGRPVLFKNTYNSMRIGPLAKTCPDAVFLVMRRNPIDIAQSILNSRVSVNDDKSRWWSLPPKEIDDIVHLPYLEQIVRQVYYIYRQIDSDRCQVGEQRFMDVSYQGLCESPGDTIQAIQSFLVANGVATSQIGKLPRSFPFSSGRKVSNEEYAQLQDLVAEIWEKDTA